jgi:hypothetical protein
MDIFFLFFAGIFTDENTGFKIKLPVSYISVELEAKPLC